MIMGQVMLAFRNRCAKNVTFFEILELAVERVAVLVRRTQMRLRVAEQTALPGK